MKCYNHRDIDTMGVCSECGQGMCDVCAVRIGGRLYCKEDQTGSSGLGRQVLGWKSSRQGARRSVWS